MSDLIQVVFKKGLLLDVTIGRWAAIHYMRPIDLLLPPDVNRKAMHLGHKKLIPEDYMKPLVQLEGKIRKFIALHTTPFPIAGASFVTYKALPTVMDGLKKYEKKFGDYADELVVEYDEAKKAQLDVLRLQAEQIAAPHFAAADAERRAELKMWLKDQDDYNLTLYPEKGVLRAKFYISRRMFKVDPIGADGVKDMDVKELMAHEAAFHQDLVQWVKQTSATSHGDLGKAAVHVKHLLSEQGKLNPKNLVAFFDALSKFESAEFAGSPWHSTVNGLKAKYLVAGFDGAPNYSVTASKINEGGQEAFMDVLDQLALLATDTTAQNVAKETLLNSDFKRVIEL
jgi:hypothetical protein